MINLEQRFKDLYNTYGGKSIRLIFYKKKYHKPYPSNSLFPSYQLYPSQAEEDIVDFIITDDRIHSDALEITQSLCTDEDLNFGACEATKMEIVVSGSKYISAVYPRNGLYPSSNLLPADNLIGREFALVESFYSVNKIYPNNKLYPSSNLFPSKDIVRGIFTVDSVPKEDDRNTRRIIAYDRMARFNQDISEWYEEINFPITLKRLRASLCSYVGIKQVNANLVNDNLIIEDTLDVETLNGRDLIRCICQINGVFGNINNAGEFKYVAIPKKNKITDTITVYKTVDSEEYIVPDIDSVKVRQEEGAIGGTSSGAGNNTYIIEGNILIYGKGTNELNQIAEKIRPNIIGLEYRPATIVGNSMPWLEMGDRLKIQTNDGDINTIIMSRTSKGIQGAVDTTESTGSQELSQKFDVVSQLVQSRGLTAKVKFSVEQVSSELLNFENQTATKFIQTSEEIELEAKRATKAEEELSTKITITAEQVSSEINKTIKATDEKLSSRINQTSEQITAEVTRAKGEETKLSSRITQTVDSITSEVNRATAAEGTLSSRITQEANKISSEITRAKNAEESLSTRITQTDTAITTEVTRAKGAEGNLSTRITQTDSSITAEINRATKAEGTLSTSITANAEAIKTKVTKGTLSSEISQEAGKITLSSNRLIVNSKNFSLDGSGNATFSGKVTGGSININNIFKVTETGDTSITGNNFSWTATNSSMTKDGNLTVKTGRIAGYYIEGNDLRAVDSNSEIKGGNVQTLNLMVEHGTEKLLNADSYAGEVNIFGDLNIGNMNVKDEIDALWRAIRNSGGCSCDNDSGGCSSDCSRDGSSSCTCDGYWESCSEYGPGC